MRRIARSALCSALIWFSGAVAVAQSSSPAHVSEHVHDHDTDPHNDEGDSYESTDRLIDALQSGSWGDVPYGVDTNEHPGNGHREHAGMLASSMFGSYSFTRDASGTSWQPDAAPHTGLHGEDGLWTWLVHGYFTAVYDNQGGPRGDTMGFGEGMLMGTAWRPLGFGTLGLKGMVSPDPWMGPRGYPEILQAGESSDGKTTLIDRQHPHDLFMELAAVYSVALSTQQSAFAYVGWPGEPALGPPAFMHRFSGAEIPEAPLSHHWLDATHITFGVVTLGWVHDTWKVEASSFNGREPDQNRFDIESREFDSSSARVSWNPDTAWALQVSQGYLKSPEALRPNTSDIRSTASASYQFVAPGLQWQTTLAWGSNRHSPGTTLDAGLLESTAVFAERHTVFGRLEQLARDDLFPEGNLQDGKTYTVGKLSLGYLQDVAKTGHFMWGLGGLYSAYAIPPGLRSAYGSEPTANMVFLRLKLVQP